jgi:hypothetical protein
LWFTPNLTGRLSTVTIVAKQSRDRHLKLSKTQNDIALEGAWTEPTAGEIFLLNDDTNELRQRILVFATDQHVPSPNTVFESQSILRLLSVAKTKIL